MKRFVRFRWVAAMMLAIALPPSTASAQEADPLSISGTFNMEQMLGTVGADLAAVFANGNDHWWRLTLHGVTYSHDYYYAQWDDEWSSGYDEQFITRVHATSFDFEIFGPDADVLNEVVSQQLVVGGLTDGAVLQLANGDYFDSYWSFGSEPYANWDISLLPPDAAAGVSFSAKNWWTYPQFSTDANGYPLIEPQRVWADYSSMTDLRPGNSGALESYEDVVDIGSAGPPYVPPTLTILDASALEGHKGTTNLVMTVKRSGDSGDTVTVNYQTADGTALAKSDYTAASGTLTLSAGQTSRTITLYIRGDRKPERNETFSVQLSGVVGATISDGVATATVLNDD